MTNLDALQAIIDDLTFRLGNTVYFLATCNDEGCSICPGDREYRDNLIARISQINRSRQELLRSRDPCFPHDYSDHLNKVDNITEAAYRAYPELQVERKGYAAA